MSALPPVPDLVARDPAAVEAEILAAFEAAVGRRLYPGQVETQLLRLLAYRESLARIQMQEVALQNLVAFARYPMLDYLGELVGVERLPAAPATTVLRFTLSASQPVPVVISARTAVLSTDARAVFLTDAALVIAAGDVAGEVSATAREPGTASNGYAPGTLTVMAEPMVHVAGVTNVSESAGGADVEDDERLRARIRAAPDAFSVAGSVASYRAHAMAAHTDVADAAVDSPQPGTVRIAILGRHGEPGPELLEAVVSRTSADDVRPLTDKVAVVTATRVPYAIDAAVTLEATADPASTYAAVTAAADAWTRGRRERLGRDVIPSQVIAAISVPGVRRVVLHAPPEILVPAQGWADCTSIKLTLEPPDE